MTVRQALAQWCEEQGFGVRAETIWTGQQPADTQYPALTLARYGGDAIETFGAGEQSPWVQFMLTGRPEEDDETERMADRLWRKLAHWPGDYTAQGVTITAVTMNNSVVIPLGPDASKRPMYSLNITVLYEDLEDAA